MKGNEHTHTHTHTHRERETHITHTHTHTHTHTILINPPVRFSKVILFSSLVLLIFVFLFFKKNVYFDTHSIMRAGE